MPFCSNMEKRDQWIVHSNQAETYIVALKPNVALEAIFGQGTLCDDVGLVTELPFLNTHDFVSHLVANNIRRDEAVAAGQCFKATDYVVFTELKSLQGMAEHHGVPKTSICLHFATPGGEWSTGLTPIDTLRHIISGSQIPRENRAGLAMTKAFLDHVWRFSDLAAYREYHTHLSAHYPLSIPCASSTAGTASAMITTPAASAPPDPSYPTSQSPDSEAQTPDDMSSASTDTTAPPPA